MEIRSYKDAIDYLEGFIGKVVFNVDPKSIKLHPPLDRMKMLLKLLDNPQDKFKSILVGGTSGKGSTAYLISHILTTAGYKTGLTISPHLQKINERLQINGKMISDEKFVEMVNSLVQTIELMKKMPVGAPSYFEILIALAFKYFAKEKVDIAVVEVGMGGEFDATNTLNPLIAVLTNVGLDHTNVLGKTVGKIAKTKAGIIKTNKESRIMNQGRENSSSIIHDSSFIIHPIVVAGVKQPSVIKIIEDRCKKVGAKLYRRHKNFNYKIKKISREGSVFDLTFNNDRVIKLNDLRLSLIGKYQVENASLAIGTVRQLADFGFKVSEENIRRALKTAFFPGRFEYLIHNTKYKILLDGAHNPTKMRAFLSTLKKLYPKENKVFIVGFKFDKDIKKMLKQIFKIAEDIIITQFKAKTDIAAHASAEALRIKDELLRMNYRGKINIEKDSKKALQIALKTIQQSNNSTIVVVTGSLYLVGEIRSML